MSNSRIHYAKPSITDLEVSYVNDAVKNGWGQHCYDYIHKFRDLLKAYLSVPYVVPTSSCTGAIHLALAALGIGHNDEVIAPDITWVASVAPVKYQGATPVLVDVCEETWCIDPDKIEAAITKKTKAIIVVHLYGNVCDMDRIMAISKKYGIPVIEDAAEALGSEYKGCKAGSMGDFATFSFHGTKTVTTGEGGALIVQSKKHYDRVMILDAHGRDPSISKQFWAQCVGYKYKMSNLDAALGAAQLERVDELVNRKREIFSLYSEQLSTLNKVQLNCEAEGTLNSFWMTTLVFDRDLKIDREKLLQKMMEANIDARVFFYPLSMMPPFEATSRNKVSYSLYERGINLPSYHDITTSEIIRVCDVIKSYVNTISCEVS